MRPYATVGCARTWRCVASGNDSRPPGPGWNYRRLGARGRAGRNAPRPYCLGPTVPVAR